MLLLQAIWGRGCHFPCVYAVPCTKADSCRCYYNHREGWDSQGTKENEAFTYHWCSIGLTYHFPLWKSTVTSIIIKLSITTKASIVKIRHRLQAGKPSLRAESLTERNLFKEALRSHLLKITHNSSQHTFCKYHVYLVSYTALVRHLLRRTHSINWSTNLAGFLKEHFL